VRLGWALFVAYEGNKVHNFIFLVIQNRNTVVRKLNLSWSVVINSLYLIITKYGGKIFTGYRIRRI